jgi:hypothetical protein
MPTFLEKILLKVLLGKVEGKLSELEGWRTKLGSAIMVLSGLGGVIAGLVCFGNCFMQGELGSHLDDLKVCWETLMVGGAAVGAGIGFHGVRRAIAVSVVNGVAKP